MTSLIYTTHPTPVGEVLIARCLDAPSAEAAGGVSAAGTARGVTPGAAATGRTATGIVTLQPFAGRLDDELERLSRAFRTLPERDDAAGGDAGEQLDAYFDGERRSFDLPLDWRLVRGFTHAALLAVGKIPYGETASYGEVAVRAGVPNAARAVGTACRVTPFSIVVPVHRVVRSDGSLGDYGGRPDVKRYLVDLERHAVGAGV